MKKFLVLLALSSVFFFGSGFYNVQAKTLKEMNNDELLSYFSNYFNFDNIILCNSSDSRYIYFYPLYGDKNSVLISDSQQYYRISRNSQDSLYPEVSKYNGSLTGNNIILSSVDVLNADNSVYYAKNYDYQKATSESTTVEFPYSREEFFLIPFLLAILICMLFFKWCFPMKGGKKI